MLVKFARPFAYDKLYSANEVIEIAVPEGYKLPKDAQVFEELPAPVVAAKKSSTTTLSQMAKKGAKGPLDEDD